MEKCGQNICLEAAHTKNSEHRQGLISEGCYHRCAYQGELLKVVLLDETEDEADKPAHIEHEGNEPMERDEKLQELLQQDAIINQLSHMSFILLHNC